MNKVDAQLAKMKANQSKKKLPAHIANRHHQSWLEANAVGVDPDKAAKAKMMKTIADANKRDAEFAAEQKRLDEEFVPFSWDAIEKGGEGK